MQLLVKWHGFEDDESTWEDIAQLIEDAKYRVRNYLAENAAGHPPLQESLIAVSELVTQGLLGGLQAALIQALYLRLLRGANHDHMQLHRIMPPSSRSNVKYNDYTSSIIFSHNYILKFLETHNRFVVIDEVAKILIL